MDKENLQFLNPVSGRDFIGYRSEITSFRDILRDFKREKTTINGLIVSGGFGLGKTSMMNILKETAETERMKTVFLNAPIGRKAGMIIKDLFDAIQPLTQEIKRGRLGRKKSPPPIPPVRLEGHNPTLEAFFENMEDREFEESTLIFIDNIDRLSNSGYEFVIKALIDLMEKVVEKKLPIFLVLAASDQTWDGLKSTVRNITTFKLDRFDISYSEILLRRSGVHSLLDSDYRKLIIDSVDRTPFILKFAVDITKWVEETLKQTKEEALGEEFLEDLDIEEVREKALPLIQDLDIFTFLKEIFQISEAEQQLLEQIANTQVNILNYEELDVDSITMSSLLDKGLLFQQDGYIQIASYGLAERLGVQSVLASTTVESEFLLNVIEGDIRMGLKPNKTMLDQLLRASTPREEVDPNAIILGAHSRQLFKVAFERNLMHGASRLATITGGFLKLGGDHEGAGNFLEEAAKMFKDRGKTHYAKELYRRAVGTYKADWKIKICARETAMIYVNLAEDAEKSGQSALVRSFLWNAYVMYKKAEEPESMRDIAIRAQQTYESTDIGNSFFKNLMPEEENDNSNL
ncbi:MAG: AAA family ATPase [Promethearchaeota archaeon]